MDFRRRYPLSLAELLLTPVIVRDSVPALAEAPLVTARGMRDLAEYGGHAPGAIRTALSRLRASGGVTTSVDAGGERRYRMAALSQSIRGAVQGRFERPAGFVVAVSSFATEQAAERGFVRSVLSDHGFHRLAQNVYVNGLLDTAELEELIRRRGLSDHLYVFRCGGGQDPALLRRLAGVFDLGGRARAQARVERELRAFLEAPGLPGDERARRILYAAPVHHRITFTEEPPLPAECLPPDYPLERVAAALAGAIGEHARDLVRYFRRVNAGATERAP